MPIDSAVVGNQLTRPINVIGDPITQSNQLNVGQFQTADSQSLAGLYDLLVGSVHLLLNPSGTFDRQRSATGTIGIPAVVTESAKATYSVGVAAFTPVATATDFFQIVGSGTKTVRVTRVSISGFASSAISVDIEMYKRTTTNTGGTSSQPTIVDHDSNDSAATAVVNLYSVNASPLGTGAILRAQKLNLGATGAAGSIIWDFTTRNSKGLVLRAASQSLCLNFVGQAVPSGTLMDIDCEWTEE